MSMITATLTPGTTATPGTTDTPAARPSLVTRPLLLRFVTILGASVSFYLPLSVMPMFAKSAGGGVGAGLVTGALLLTTVAVELVTPRLLARTGYRLSLTAGLLMLGAPALALLVSSNPAVLIGVSIVRGAGFAITTVAGGALTAALIPPERRGEGLGLVGIVSGIPALVALPAGVWIAVHWGFQPVFAATAAAALLALVVLPGVPDQRGLDGDAPGVLSHLGDRALLRPAAIFSASTMAAGVLVTFLPLAIAGRSAAVATIALFAQPAAATLARWAAGKTGDRRGHAMLLCPGVALSAVGMAALAATSSPVLVIAGATAFGMGFGLLQNATLTLMYARVPSSGHTAVSAIWNAAYDAGMGAGAIGMGLVAGLVGYPGVFLLTAALAVPALLPARRERAQSRTGR
jgi:predicted MFS family arabinose efflux permease